MARNPKIGGAYIVLEHRRDQHSDGLSIKEIKNQKICAEREFIKNTITEKRSLIVIMKTGLMIWGSWVSVSCLREILNGVC